jgi:hypothetical protein
VPSRIYLIFPAKKKRESIWFAGRATVRQAWQLQVTDRQLLGA